MTKDFENSISELTPAKDRTLITAAFSTTTMVSLVGMVSALRAENWMFPVLFLIAFASSIGAWYLASRNERRSLAEIDRPKVGWQTAMPEIQRQNLNVEVIQLSKVLDVSSDQISDLQSAYIVAEDLALRQIQQEEAALLLRHITIGKVPFTAVLVKHDYVACIEVSFVVSPELRQDRIEAIIRKIAAVKAAVKKEGLKLDVRLMLVLITQLTSEDEDKLRRTVKKRFADTPVTSDIRFLDFESLQRIYVTD